MEGNKNVNLSFETLVNDHIKYAKRVAMGFYLSLQNLDFDKDDFEGAALLGLCKAAKKYDPTKCPNFRSYGFLRIRGEILDLIRKDGGISNRLYTRNKPNEPEEKDQTVFFKKYNEQVSDDLETVVRLAAIMEESGINVQVMKGAYNSKVIFSEEQDPEKAVINKSIRNYIKKTVAKLPKNQRNVIERRYYEELSFDEIAELFGGASKSWLCRLHTKALDTLESHFAKDVKLLSRIESQYLKKQ